MVPGGHLDKLNKGVKSWMPALFSHSLPENYKLWDGPFDAKSNKGGLNWKFPNHEIIDSIRILNLSPTSGTYISVWLKTEASKKYRDSRDSATKKAQGMPELGAMQRKKPTIDIKMRVVYSDEEMVLNFDSIIVEPK
jgi:hypothetical protein